MQLTAKIKLTPDGEQASLLGETLVRCNEACNWIASMAWERQTFKQFSLHKIVYKEARERFGLGAQAVIRCIAKVADAYKLDRKNKRVFQLGGAVSFDNRLLKFGETYVSIWTLEGRKKVSFVCGEHQSKMLATQKGESKLSLQDGTFYLLATCEIPEEPTLTAQGILGVDLGIENIATDSDGVSYGGDVRKRRSRFHKTRRSFQRTNTKSSKRKLSKRARKEHRFSQDVNHCIAKQLVEKAKRTEQAISVEDLKGIRLGNRVSRQLRRELHSWAFYDLQQKIEYKAKLAGVSVLYVAPAYTSQTCSVCGHCQRSNRKSQSEFSCKSCDTQLHADHNAAMNIAAKAIVNWPNVVHAESPTC
jgi:putative transposase